MPLTRSNSKIQPLSTAVVSLILIGLSIALILLEERLQHAFIDMRIQYPNSSLAEWLFINLDPANVDIGPTVAKFAVGGFSLGAALLSVVLELLRWFAAGQTIIRMFSGAACIASVANTVAAIGFTVYVFMAEAHQHLPEWYTQWRLSQFTQEFFVCEAFPSLVANLNSLYGFSACSVSRTGKYVMLSMCCISAVLAGLSVIQGHKDEVFAVFTIPGRKDRHKYQRRLIEADREKRSRERDVEGFSQEAARSRSSSPPSDRDSTDTQTEILRRPDEVKHQPGHTRQPRASLYGYYGRL